MEKSMDTQMLAEMETQVDQFQDNWKDATGRAVSRQMYQAIKNGIKISLKKEEILSMCRTIVSQCQAVMYSEAGETSPNSRKTLSPGK